MKILCAGPTSIDKRVLAKMAQNETNPDLDPAYTEFHRSVEEKFSALLKTKEKTILMLGEGMIALEASVCSLMERGERVLVLYNGYFGEGFKEYVRFFGGEAVLYPCDFEKGINVEELREFLKKDHDFAIATMVHCETPSGITNDIQSICTLLKEYGILSIVDAVSSVGGEDIDFDAFHVDLLLSASQKAISAPTGLSTITISQRALEKMRKREEIPSYYMNLLNYMSDTDGFSFPYTMSEGLTYALNEALDLLIEKDGIALHKKYAENTRKVFQECGFELFPRDSFSNTVTAVRMPEGITSTQVLEEMKKRGILLSKGIGEYENLILRIGHMGHNISYDNFNEMYGALDESFKALELNRPSLQEAFQKTMKKED